MKSINKWLQFCLLFLLIFPMGCGREQERATSEAGESHSPAGRPQSTARYGGTLVIGLAQEPRILLEFLVGMDAVSFIGNMIFSKFVRYDNHLNLVPDLLTEIPTVENGGISADYLTYTYHLRRNAVWHDGRPVTSQDVQFTFDVLMHPDVNTETREGLDVIEEMLAPDPHTIVVKLKHIHVDLVGDLFFEECILPKHLLEGKIGKEFSRLPFQTRPVGSGPFILKEWVHGSHIRLVANRDFYKGRPYLDEIVVKFIPNMNTMLVQLETGEIDGFQQAEISHLQRLKSMPGTVLHRVPKLAFEHIDFNTDHPWLSDNRVRMAIALGIDRKQIIDKLFAGVYKPAYSDMPPMSSYHNPEVKKILRYDPEKAAGLLEEAGWHLEEGATYRTRNGKRLQFEISTTKEKPERELTQLLLIEQMKKLGIELKIKNYFSTVLFASQEEGGIIKTGKFDWVMFSWYAAPDPSSLESIYSEHFIPPDGQNYSRFRNKNITELLKLGTMHVAFGERKKIYDEVAEIIAREVPMVALYWRVNIDPFRDSLQNYKPSPSMSGSSWDCNEWWLSDND